MHPPFDPPGKGRHTPSNGGATARKGWVWKGKGSNPTVLGRGEGGGKGPPTETCGPDSMQDHRTHVDEDERTVAMGAQRASHLPPTDVTSRPKR